MLQGRELDALVAEKVMGIRVTHEQGDYWPPPAPGANFSTQPILEYSTNIAAAWEVVNRMRENGSKVQIQMSNEGDFAKFNTTSSFWHMAGPKEGAVSVPHAICLAALKACGAL